MIKGNNDWAWPLHTIFDEVFDDLSKVMSGDFAESKPKINVWETDEGFGLELAAPGFQKEEIKVDLNGNKLVVEGKKNKSEDETVKNFKRREFYYTNFKKSYELPDTINVNKIEASYENGILMLNLPKRKEEERTEREIKIQ